MDELDNFYRTLMDAADEVDSYYDLGFFNPFVYVPSIDKHLNLKEWINYVWTKFHGLRKQRRNEDEA